MGADLVIGANTTVEVSHSRSNTPRLNWALPRVKVEPITEQAAKAAELLKGAGLHGHTYAIDAAVTEVALRQPRPVASPTPGSNEMTKLCEIRIVPLRPVGPPRAHTLAGSVALPTSVPHPCPAERTTAVRYSFQRPGLIHLQHAKVQVRAPLAAQEPLIPKLRPCLRSAVSRW
ncbi:hypothetical protein SCMC78_33350 [Streptomyces sp. CMC78]|uniref:Uncharacterized protein n=1 Tax=Streptomyces sp. CMC78 TaxID=3231512 RepID=A0AB33KIS6_9ACTN